MEFDTNGCVLAAATKWRLRAFAVRTGTCSARCALANGRRGWQDTATQQAPATTAPTPTAKVGSAGFGASLRAIPEFRLLSNVAINYERRLRDEKSGPVILLYMRHYYYAALGTGCTLTAVP